MHRLSIALIVGMVLGSQWVGLAEKKVPTGTIALADGSDLRLGGTVWFDWTAANISGGPRSDPRIQVLCYQDAQLVYGQAGPADLLFLLGGGSSTWRNETQGPAHCTADLFYWSYQGGVQQFNLLDSLEFDAGGL